MLRGALGGQFSDLQRSRGNDYVQRLATVAEGARPTLMREKVDHTSGKKVDTYLKTSDFFKAYVKEKMKGGTTAESAVKIHNAEDFKKEWIAYAKVRQNPDTGAKFTEEEAEEWEPKVNAFQAPGKIHIHEERGEAGTAIHESLHLFTDSSYSSKYGFNVNEGTTEVFTRKLCAEQSITRGTFYPSQRKSLDKLVELVGEDTVGNAYFDGKYDELKKAVDDAKEDGTFDSWLGKMKRGKYSEADALL